MKFEKIKLLNMKKTKLSKEDVQDLLDEYQSRLKKFEFYVEETVTAINKLEKSLATAKSENEKPAKRGRKPRAAKLDVKKKTKGAKRGRKPKKVAAALPKELKKRGRKPKAKKAKAPKKRGRKPTKKAPRNYKLSNWDNLLIKTLEEKKMALIKSEFVEAAKASTELVTPEMTPEQIEVKVTQSLHKLANKKKLVAKVKYYGKGFAYALKQWITRKGDLMTIYRR